MRRLPEACASPMATLAKNTPLTQEVLLSQRFIREDLDTLEFGGHVTRLVAQCSATPASVATPPCSATPFSEAA